MKTRTSRDVRSTNRLEVLQRMYAAAPATRRQLAADTGLSPATVAVVINELLEWRVAQAISLEDSGGGRPRARIAINASYGSIIGVNITKTHLQVDLFDMALELRASDHQPRDPEVSAPSYVVELIEAGVHRCLSEVGATLNEIVGMGVSVPGQVDPSGGVSVYAPNINWRQVPFAELLSERLAVPLYVDNPLKANAVAERWLGVGRTVRDFCALTMGTGVGAGIVIGGNVLRGMANVAGEWGHTVVKIDGRRCQCGNRGCIETYIGAPGIMQHIRETAPASPYLHPDDQESTIAGLASALAEHDQGARAVLDETARYLGIGIANLSNTLNPEAIVVDGWVARELGAWLLPAATETAKQYLFDRTNAAVRVLASELMHNPVSLGAAIFALEQHIAELSAARYQ